MTVARPVTVDEAWNAYLENGRNLKKAAKQLKMGLGSVRRRLNDDLTGPNPKFNTRSDGKATCYDISPVRAYEAYVANRGQITFAAKALGVHRSVIKRLLDEAKKDGADIEKPISGGIIAKPPEKVMPLPKKGELARYIITSAQNNTDAHTDFFNNLITYAEYLDAQLMVGSYSYNRAAYAQKSTKRGYGPTEDDTKDDWYDPVFDPYFVDEGVELAPTLQWRGELNILPTAKRPLSSLETYTGRKSSIFPHAKVAMLSVAGTKSDGAKLAYTTGTATLMNYISKKIGYQAEFHHVYGAVVVEVDYEGDWFVRHLIASNDGSFYDIPNGVPVFVNKGVESGAVEAITWGDLHARVIDEQAKEIAFAEGGMLDSLRPKEQHVHDVLDFASKKHHDAKDAHRLYRKHILQWENVRGEVREVGELLDYIRRDWCRTVIIDANHDRHLERWLNESDFRKDHQNATFILEAELAYRRFVDRHPNPTTEYNFFKEALIREGFNSKDIFLSIDDSWIICNDDRGGIECALHGDIGPGGAKGSPTALSRMGRRANTGHTHAAAIVDGLYVAGCMSLLEQNWNRGPSAWSHSHIVTYPNGKRTIVTFRNGKWRG